ncbi:MAG: YraN family protein, partial [Chryseobacterium sp.]|nr:YraN family protein [Candidatus Chryseobacterium enterohippi]
MADHNDFGKVAEDLAVDFLEKAGYKILVRNFRFRHAELDIIAQKDELVVVVEVKARNSDAFISPQEAVTKSKIKLIILATDHYLATFNPNKEVRFDIISVQPDESGKLAIEHLPDAFDAYDAINFRFNFKIKKTCYFQVLIFFLNVF